MLPTVNHPHELARCNVTETEVTHVASARNRDAMHKSIKANVQEVMTDSINLLHVVGGGNYYKIYPGYKNAIKLAGPPPALHQNGLVARYVHEKDGE